MAKKKSKNKGAKVLAGFVGVVAIGAVTVGILSQLYDPKIAPGTYLGNLDLGGKTRESAYSAALDYWKEKAEKPLTLVSTDLSKNPEGMTPNSIGVNFDVRNTMDSLPKDNFFSHLMMQVSGQKPAKKIFTPKLSVEDSGVSAVEDFVKKNSPDIAPASADLVGGKVVTIPEKVGLALDRDLFKSALVTACWIGEPIEIPLKKAEMKVTLEQLSQITDVVSSYTSRYSEGNANRASNIKNAAKRLSGKILMPGEVFSFNGVLGRRTAENGFKLAGVYNNGKHDFDIGGGICQVSGTLYNAVLLADLKIKTRSNHTFPVPYLPVGRDATVSFPAPDFAFINSMDSPIAISVSSGGGQITFRILGKKDPSLQVKVETAGHTSWSHPEKIINDPGLPPGRRVVEEPGGAGHRISTFRIVMRDGKILERESLGTSIYNGGRRIVRANLSAPKTAPVQIQEKVVDNESPDAPPPSTSSSTDGE